MKEDRNYFVHESAYLEKGVTIGAGTQIWCFCHILENAQIGAGCMIGQNVVIDAGTSIGNRCKIQNNVSIYKGVVLSDGVFCGPSCVFTNVLNPRAEIERKDEIKKTLVGRGATIGANATIICGVELGEYCLIGAGATVTKDVLPHALVVGNPAKQVGWVSHAGEILKEDLICPREKRQYYLSQASGGLTFLDICT